MTVNYLILFDSRRAITRINCQFGDACVRYQPSMTYVYILLLRDCSMGMLHAFGSSGSSGNKRTCAYLGSNRIQHSETSMLLENNKSLQWCDNEDCGVNNRRLQCLFSRVLRHTSKKTSTLRATGALWGESTVDRWIPLTRASNAENISISWRHHLMYVYVCIHLFEAFCWIRSSIISTEGVCFTSSISDIYITDRRRSSVCIVN